MPRPVATVVIPVYNQKPEWLVQAVQSAADQTVPVEIIVVDDGSDDQFLFLAPVRQIRHENNKGIAAALNTGIKAMTTDWFCWLSSDDLMAMEKTAIQLRYLQETGLKASCHPYEVVNPGGGLIGYSAIPPLMVEDIARCKELGSPIPDHWQYKTLIAQQQDFSGNCWVNGSTCMIHRSVIEDVGGLDESLSYSQDWMWWVNIGRKYHWLFINKILGRRREGNNLTERISQDHALRLQRDAEDRRVREVARSYLHEMR
jgi:glycosyltransferase involved in cell wall biosynthesis